MKIVAITVMAMLIACPADAMPAPAAFMYCSAPSSSPRGSGLIITAIFRSRSDQQFVATAFENYLRRSYAPYGNGWIFPERSAACARFDDRGDAEKRRALDISQVSQPARTVFNVSFELG